MQPVSKVDDWSAAANDLIYLARGKPAGGFALPSSMGPLSGKLPGYVSGLVGIPKDDPDCTPPRCAGGAGLALPRGAAAAAAATAGDCATYRKIVDAECADACLPDPVGICPRSIVVSSGGLDGGACKDLNYTQADGTTSQSAGPCGTLNFNKWKKP